MKTILRTCLIWVVAATSVPAASTSLFAQGHDKSVAEQTRYCKTVYEFTQSNPPNVFLAEVEPASSKSRARWREFPTKEELEKDEHHLNAALVWLRDSKIVAANLTISSGSGDWFQYGDYCFDSDGRLAEVKEELRTSYGSIVAKRTYVYDGTGKLLEKIEKFTEFDNTTPKQPNEDFIDEILPIYLRSDDLPFIQVLRQKKR